MEPHADAPDWEILKLIREVRRRVNAGDPTRFLARLEAAPRWIAALPEPEAKVAGKMIELARELARRAVEARAAAPSFADVDAGVRALPASDIPDAEIEIVELLDVDLAPAPVEESWAPALARKANRRHRRDAQAVSAGAQQMVLLEVATR